MRDECQALPISPTACELLIAVGSHPKSTREGSKVRLQHPTASFDAIATQIGKSDRYLRTIRRELNDYHGVLTCKAFHDSRPAEWIVDMGVVINRPLPLSDEEPSEDSRTRPGQRLLFSDNESQKPLPSRPMNQAVRCLAIACRWLITVASSGPETPRNQR